MAHLSVMVQSTIMLQSKVMAHFTVMVKTIDKAHFTVMVQSTAVVPNVVPMGAIGPLRHLCCPQQGVKIVQV